MRTPPFIEKLTLSPTISCFAGMMILWISFGVRQSFGLYLIPITQDYGWSRSTFSIAAALLQLFWGCSQPFLVYLSERYIGFGKTIFFSSIIYGIGCIVMQLCSPSQSGLFIFAMGIIVGGAAGGNSFPNILASIGILSVAVSPFAFFLQTVEPVSQEPAPKSVRQSEEQHDPDGFKEAVISNEPQTIGAALKEGFSSLTFWLIILGYSVCGFHVSFIATHLPAYLVGQGIDSSVSAWTVSVLGFGSMIGTVLVGYLCTSYRPKYILAGIYSLRAIILAIFIFVPLSLASVFSFSAIFGFLWLSTVPATTKFVGDVYGHRYLGTMSSITFVGHQIGAFCGAYIGGLEYDVRKSYTRMWYATLAMAIVAAIANYVANDTSLRGHHPQQLPSKAEDEEITQEKPSTLCP
ncbi:MFS general substrate transporter [Basidiobolus meristosporus CBS 931.73]|uniref:MFS general substrate transporter n=1 Tax=Basidiobolus meristosporus CBS 931.73 TaxID=1314790 RepID=A0A1Y1X5R8_9FUNG|nr:MFS general substrate transporter [Basidiobolus meristosporus CBS 931.73]|eukprot:ORX80998.1 MFS general substrate transporter [Basidiobolus meristosporus CBS 931.73]